MTAAPNEFDHAHWAEVDDDDGYPAAKEDAGIPNWKDAPPIVPACNGEVRAEA